MRTKSANTAAGMAVILAAIRLSGADVPPLDSLVANSPFGKPASSVAGAAADTPLELRGVFVDKGEAFFSLYDVAGRRAMWVGLKEAGNPYVVQGYDLAKGTVTVEFQGRTLSVGLKQAKIIALPPAPPPGVQANTAPAPGQAVATAAAPAPEEATRLAQIAEEIRRRRAIRSQAMQPAALPPPASGTRP